MTNSKIVNDDVMICHLSKTGEVLDKNPACVSHCEREPNQPCVHFSGKMAGLKFYENGFYRGPTISIGNGQYADTIFLITVSRIIIIHHLVSQEWLEWNGKIKESGLTSSEQEIADMLLARFSNSSICQLKCISHATLKTHINHIYQKIPGMLNWRQKQETFELNQN